MTLPKEIVDASTRVAVYSRGGTWGRGCGGQGGGRAGGSRNGRQKHKYKYCKMDNHTSETCGRRKHTENDTPNGDTNTSKNNKPTSYHWRPLGHLKADFIDFKHAWDQCNKVNSGTTPASLATAGDRNLIWQAKNATALTAASDAAPQVIDSRASHDMCNDRTRFNSIKNLRQSIVIELEEDNKVTVSHHWLINGWMEYKFNALYTPTFRLSFHSINQLDTARYTSTFGRSKCSISSLSITITGNRVNDL